MDRGEDMVGPLLKTREMVGSARSGGIPRWEMLVAGIGQGGSLGIGFLSRFRLGTIYKEKGEFRG